MASTRFATPNRQGGRREIGTVGGSDSEHIREARVRLEAAERLLAHALVSADVFTLDEIGEHVLTLVGQADRHLSVAA